MAKGVKHYLKDGKEHKGAMHKDASGKLMTGKTHTKNSQYIFHFDKLSKKAKEMAKKNFNK